MIDIVAPPIASVEDFLSQTFSDSEYLRTHKPNGDPYRAEDVSGRRCHAGFDLQGDPTLDAVCDGILEAVDFGPSYGIQSVVRAPNGSGAFYAHQARRLVRDGARLLAGQPIGVMGGTGGVPVHLHFSVAQRWNVARFENCGPQLRALQAKLRDQPPPAPPAPGGDEMILFRLGTDGRVWAWWGDWRQHIDSDTFARIDGDQSKVKQLPANDRWAALPTSTPGGAGGIVRHTHPIGEAP